MTVPTFTNVLCTIMRCDSMAMRLDEYIVPIRYTSGFFFVACAMAGALEHLKETEWEKGYDQGHAEGYTFGARGG